MTRLGLGAGGLATAHKAKRDTVASLRAELPVGNSTLRCLFERSIFHLRKRPVRTLYCIVHRLARAPYRIESLLTLNVWRMLKSPVLLTPRGSSTTSPAAPRKPPMPPVRARSSVAPPSGPS